MKITCIPKHKLLRGVRASANTSGRLGGTSFQIKKHVHKAKDASITKEPHTIYIGVPTQPYIMPTHIPVTYTGTLVPSMIILSIIVLAITNYISKKVKQWIDQ